MKRLILCIVMLSFISEVWAGSLLKVGIDAGGSQKKYDVSVNIIGVGNVDLGSETYTPDTGISVAYEYTKEAARNLDLGVGVSLELPRSLDKKGGSYYFMPIYALGKLSLTNFPVYLIGHLGYNLINADSTYKINDFFSLTGGMYYAIGVGKNFDKYCIEALYSVNNASMDGKGYAVSGGSYYDATGSGKITNSKINVSMGYKF